MFANPHKQPFLRQLSAPQTADAVAHGLPAEQGRSAATATTPDWLVQPFCPISLDELNAKADMLQRLDNKYVIPAADLERAMPELAKHFDVLEIEGQRDFTYETCYFDGPSLTNYFDQHRGRRKRCKVRMRKYVDAGLCFVEVKLKAKRSITVKKRLACDPAQYGALDEVARAFIRSVYKEQYGSEYDLALKPAVEMRYQRVTLVAKQGGERMTIDYALEFAGASGSRNVDGGIFLLETKSANANGIADKVLRALHQHPTEGCSKYCVAMATLKEVTKYNKFLVALRKLDIMPNDGSAAPAAAVKGIHSMACTTPSASERQVGGFLRQQLAGGSRC